MAFQPPQQRSQPLRPVPHIRTSSDPSLQQHLQQPSQHAQHAPPSPARQRLIEESQEWILFSPAQRDYSRTSGTLRTATQSSDFGSLEAHDRSQLAGSAIDDVNTASPTGEVIGDINDDEDPADLDSLDDGLHAFHHPFSTSSNPLDQSGGTVLPRHDGFGMFPSTAGMQEQLWQFERYNPHRRKHARRRSTVQKQLDAMEEEGEEMDVEDERTARIEKWRLDQSNVVLEEIEKETRRRRRRMSRLTESRGSIDATTAMSSSAMAADSVLRRQRMRLAEGVGQPKMEEPPNESFWQRITRKVIQDLIGLDENTLSVILGESLPEDPSPTPRQASPLAAAAAKESRVAFQDPSYTWEVRLIDRIARELGVLVNRFSGHEGAFSTYLSTLEELEYAGLGKPSRDLPARQPSLRQQRQQQTNGQTLPSPSDPLFVPTLGQNPVSALNAPDSSLWGIEEEPPSDEDALAAERQRRQYWEREIDVSLIFRYLRDRLIGTSHGTSQSTIPSSNTPTGPLPASWATENTRESTLRRAEIIRRQHPLVSRAAAQQTRRRQLHHESLLRRQLVQQQRRVAGGGSSSCASQSTRRSRRSRSASSRPFWDLGGSVGSVGSGAAVMSSGLGGWGEV